MASLKTQLVVLAMVSCSLTVKADEPLRFVSDVWPPYQYEDEQGQAKGICVELISKVFQRLGKQVKIEFYLGNEHKRSLLMVNMMANFVLVKMSKG